MRDHDLVLTRELDHPFHEGRRDGGGRRIVREVHDQELRPRPAACDDFRQMVEEFLAMEQRDAMHLRAGDHASILMNRVGRSRG